MGLGPVDVGVHGTNGGHAGGVPTVVFGDEGERLPAASRAYSQKMCCVVPTLTPYDGPALAIPPSWRDGIASIRGERALAAREVDLVRLPTCDAQLIVLPPPCPLSVTPIDFGRADELIERGLDDARAFLDGARARRRQRAGSGRAPGGARRPRRERAPVGVLSAEDRRQRAGQMVVALRDQQVAPDRVAVERDDPVDVLDEGDGRRRGHGATAPAR